MIEKIKRVIFAIMSPRYWVQNYRYNSKIEDVINCLDWDNIRIESNYNAVVGGLRLWIANHPYASFEIYSEMPSRLTRYRLMKKIKPKLEEYHSTRRTEAIRRLKEEI